MNKKQIRCAIYTRKSTEEGLEQDFNSLDAQREACEAYIKSQMHEGWVLVEKQYNDGGFSGGTMERPAFKELLKDIENDEVDIVVVYKVDRLTRSLMDFSKIIDVLDKHETSFVSITQQFNTTTSMGRLTLNILLSFAQFEREVTGERIRDKFAASKKKGMWMGGRVPIGYIRENKKLFIDKSAAHKVQHIFEKYLEFKSVPKLKEYLKNNQIFTNSGKDFGKGQIYHILSNQIYIGKITHKGNVYEGEQEPIIEEELFNKSQKLLQENTINKDGEYNHSNSLLAGFLYDDKDNKMSPSHSNTRKKKYRYYSSKTPYKSEVGTINKIPAPEIESFIRKELLNFVKHSDQIQTYISHFDIHKQKDILIKLHELEKFEDVQIRAMLYKVSIQKDKINIHICKKSLIQTLESIAYNTILPPYKKQNSTEFVCLTKDVQLVQCSSKGKSLIIKSGKNEANYNIALIKAIVRSHYWHSLLLSGRCKTIKDIQALEGLNDTKYIRQILKLRFLDPQITEDIISGTQDGELSVKKMFI